MLSMIIILIIFIFIFRFGWSDRAYDRYYRAQDGARGIELEIGLRITDARGTVLAHVSSLVLSILFL